MPPLLKGVTPPPLEGVTPSPLEGVMPPPLQASRLRPGSFRTTKSTIDVLMRKTRNNPPTNGNHLQPSLHTPEKIVVERG